MTLIGFDNLIHHKQVDLETVAIVDAALLAMAVPVTLLAHWTLDRPELLIPRKGDAPAWPLPQRPGGQVPPQERQAHWVSNPIVKHLVSLLGARVPH